MCSWLLPRGKRLLVEAPAVSSHRAAVMLGLLISGDGVVECCQYSIPHPVDVFGVSTHSPAVVGRQLVDGCLGKFPKAPRVMPAFFPDAANLQRAVPSRLAMWLMHFAFSNSTSPYTRKLVRRLNVLASPSPSMVVQRKLQFMERVHSNSAAFISMPLDVPL